MGDKVRGINEKPCSNVDGQCRFECYLHILFKSGAVWVVKVVATAAILPNVALSTIFHGQTSTSVHVKIGFFTIYAFFLRARAAALQFVPGPAGATFLNDWDALTADELRARFASRCRVAYALAVCLLESDLAGDLANWLDACALVLVPHLATDAVFRRLFRKLAGVQSLLLTVAIEPVVSWISVVSTPRVD